MRCGGLQNGNYPRVYRLASQSVVMVRSVMTRVQPAARENLPAEVLKISRETPEAHIIEYAAGFIKRGQVVAIPTDTFYGLSADPFNLSAVERIFLVKGRPESQALPILVGSIEQAATLMRDAPDIFFTLANKFWPGALTLIVEATHRLPLKVTGNTGHVAVRWAKSNVADALIQASGGPVTGTSANLSGHRSCSTAAQILEQLDDRVPLILDAGKSGGTLASTIVRIEGDDWSVVRKGTLSEAKIRKGLASG